MFLQRQGASTSDVQPRPFSSSDRQLQSNLAFQARKATTYSSFPYFLWLVAVCFTVFLLVEEIIHPNPPTYHQDPDVPFPWFLIIGTWKGGTTSLRHYFDIHPHTCMAQTEVKFFIYKNKFRNGLRYYRDRWFSHCGNSQYIGEKSAGYLSSRGAPGRVYQVAPKVKAIALLRNPINRIHSHWWMSYCKGRVGANFDRYARSHINRNFGVYYPMVRRWLNMFPREQLLFLRSEDFFINTTEVLGHIQEFLAIPRYNFTEKEISKVFGSSPVCERQLGPRPPMSEKTFRYLQQFYRKHNRRLEELLGMKFHWDDEPIHPA